ncbi:MAG: hypothetical protein JWQ09_5316 [Segetibacter sp.]|nr:hypothetical protein [Segetibacter sp.]
MMKDGAVKIHLFRNFILTHFINGKELIKEFKANLGLKTFFDYASVYLGTISNLFNNYRENQKISWLLNIDPSSKQLIETFALRPKDIPAKGFQGLYGSVIPKPVYFIMDKYPVIIDYNYLGFLVNTAFAYNFYSYTSLKKQKRFDEYKGFLGKEFYETFAAGKLLQNIFSKSAFFSGNHLNEYTDFATVRDEKEIFLFEVKSTSIHFRILEEVKVEEFKQYIINNFIQQKGEGSKNKGVYQLVKAIEQLSLGKLFPSSTLLKKLKQCKVYPIIVYTEPVLDTHGVNSFCNEHFQQAIAGWKQNFNHVYPLTLINLDFFISYYPKLKNKLSLLPTLIKQYHDRVKSGFSSFRRSSSAYFFLNANIAFAYFIYKTQPDPGASARQISEDLALGFGDPAEEEAW